MEVPPRQGIKYEYMMRPPLPAIKISPDSGQVGRFYELLNELLHQHCLVHSRFRLRLHRLRNHPRFIAGRSCPWAVRVVWSRLPHRLGGRRSTCIHIRGG